MNLIGKTLGQYQIVEQIGQGGMATVFKAYQPTLDRYVAVKALLAQQALATGFYERFMHEARTVARLNHPNILPIIDFGQQDGTSYIVMKLVSGSTLRERLNQPLDLAETARFIEQIAAALDHAHGKGVLHRDVKPSNVLLDEGDWVQLADFGLAKLVASDVKLTASGASVGTPAYMSPEQAQGLEIDLRTDVYALGVILYEMLTGQAPFQAATPMAVMLQHMSADPPSPCKTNPALPLAVEDVTLKSLEKKPNRRYASAGELARALQEAIVAPQHRPSIVPISPGDVPMGEPPAMFPPTSLTPATKMAEAVPQTIPSRAAQEFVGAPSQKPELTPPPEPTRPPQVIDFVGRKAELAYYADKLAARQPAVIAGMAGVGKTALALALAQRVTPPDQVFWHAFHEGEGVDALLWKLAGFLAWRGQEDVWHMLQGAQESGGQPPPTPVLFDYLFQTLRGRGYLLCLDDFQFVDDDPLLNQLVERLCEGVEAGELSLIITSRRMPDFANASEYEALAGLSAADSDGLLAAQGVQLPEALSAELYTHTEGNAELLTLALDALKRTNSPERLIAHLAETDDIERYLVSEVDEGLSENEREVMSAVALLLGYPSTRDAIETALDGGSVRRALGDLARRHLLSVGQGQWGREYGQHALLRAFYYDLLGRRQRRDMHCRAGEFYETEEPDALKAARHYERGGEYEQAAQLASGDVWALINQGQARALSRLLERFQPQQVEAEQWARLNVARGQVYALLGEGETAQKSYQDALSQLDKLVASPAVHTLQARACRGMGELFQHTSPQQTLDWLHRGLDALAGASTEEQAALRIRMGYVQVAVMGEHKAALSALQEGLELLSEGPSQLRATALLNLGTIYCTQGEIERGVDFYRRALEVSQQLSDHWRMADIRMNIAIQAVKAGDWETAAREYGQALDLAEKLGSTRQQAALALNLGDLEMKQGDDELAEKHLSQCLALVQEQGFKLGQAICQVNLARLYRQRGEPDVAATTLTEAETLAVEINMKNLLPEIYREWAQIRLLQEQPQPALDHIEQSVNLARELGLSPEEGISLRVLGQALLANGQPEPALTAFADSLSILADLDPYEAARTNMHWGRYLSTGADVEQGTRLLQQARATFAGQGARRDLAAVERALQRH